MGFGTRVFSGHRARADAAQCPLSTVGKDPSSMNARTTIISTVVVLSAAASGSVALGCCAPGRPPSSPSVPAPVEKAPDSPPHVYKLDFSITSGEANAPPVKEQFVLNLADRQHGDVTVGRNVPLQATAPNGGAAPRADVGLRLMADCISSGDDVLVQVRLEVSDAETATATGAVPIHKVNAQGAVLLRPGQPALALRVDDGHKLYEVDVTATLLR